MGMEKNSSNKVLLAVLGVAILVVAVVGVSFAVFSLTKTGATNSISTATIAMTYEEAENAIEITDAMPTADATGKASTTYFAFSVTANASGAVTVPYEVTFTEVAEQSQLSASDVMLYLTDDQDVEKVAPALASTFTTPGTYRDTAKLLTSGSFTFTKGNTTAQTDNYRLRMWLKSDATVTGDARTYKIKVNVDSHVNPIS